MTVLSPLAFTRPDSEASIPSLPPISHWHVHATSIVSDGGVLRGTDLLLRGTLPRPCSHTPREELAWLGVQHQRPHGVRIWTSPAARSLCPAIPAHPFLPTRSHHTPHLRSVCCEVLSASRDCGCPGCDGILGIRMTDPQAGRRRWPWPISAISRVGLLWWSGSCRHHFRTSPDFSVRRPVCLCCNLGSGRTHVREGWGQWRTRWSSRRVRWVWGVLAAGGRAWVDRLSIATASPEMRCAMAVPGRAYQPTRTAHGRSTPDRMQWLAEQSAWRAMGAVGCDGDMARHLGTRSECASHQTQLGSGSSLAASAQPTQPPTPPWTDAGQTCWTVMAQRCAVSAESVSVASTTAAQHTCGWTCGWSCERPWV